MQRWEGVLCRRSASFADETRLERDLLADAADAHLLKLFGKLGGG